MPDLIPLAYFKVLIKPVPKGRPRFWQGRILTDSKTRAFEREFAKLTLSHRPRTPFKGALSLALTFNLMRPKSVKRKHPTCKPDVDNFCKSAMDALSAFWEDDAQVVSVSATKQYNTDESIIVRIQQAEQ